jgi:hypothetical protein
MSSGSTSEDGKHSQGLTILDRPPQNFFEINARRDTLKQMPEGPAKEAAWKQWALWQGGAAFGAPRLFVGRDTRKAAVVDRGCPIQASQRRVS